MGLVFVLLVPAAVVAQKPANARETGPVGVLVMAHGGDEEWNRAVLEATAPVAGVVPTVVAFGMADPAALRVALDSLQDLGVERVAVVRMFISGAAFLDQTEYLLGLSETPPTRFIPGAARRGAGDNASAGGVPSPLDHRFAIATHWGGLVDAAEVGDIVAERALASSVDPASESVLLLAHGMGDETLDDELLGAMRELESTVAERSFASVRSATLREDWAEARAAAEEDIRAFVRSENERGRRVIVVPLRLSGFGPYADVLDGLDYVAGGALLPHEEAAEWIVRTACAIVCAEGWDSPLMAMMVAEPEAR